MDGADDVRRGERGLRRDAPDRAPRRSIAGRERRAVQRIVHPRRTDRRRGYAALPCLRRGQFIESGAYTPYIQTGETKYGKPVLDRVVTPSTSLDDATKCVLVSFDSTMRSNISVGMPIDLLCYERDSLEVRMRRCFAEGDPYFVSLQRNWSDGTRRVFRELPTLAW